MSIRLLSYESWMVVRINGRLLEFWYSMSRTTMLDKEYHGQVTKSLNTLMKMRGLDVAEFSERCGIPVERMESFLAGEKELMVPDLVAISRTYNVTTDYILDCFPFSLPSPRMDKERELFEKISNIDQDRLGELPPRLKVWKGE